LDLCKSVGRQYFPHPGLIGVPHDEVEVFVFACLLANKGVDPPAAVQPESTLAMPSHPRISTTSAAVIVIPEPYRHPGENAANGRHLPGRPIAGQR
jgi:hypothetical protein